MKIKQFFINNKSNIKKVFSIFLIVLLFLFYSYTTFACGFCSRDILDYDDKINSVEYNQNLNKENTVEVLRKKEPFENNTFSTVDSVFTIGYVRTTNSNAEIIYFMNIKDIELITYNGGTPNTYEYELKFKTYIFSYAYYDLNNTYAVSLNKLYEFSVYTDETTSILKYMKIGISYFDYQLNGISKGDIESFNADVNLYFDIYIEIGDYNDNVIYENEISYEDTDPEYYSVLFSSVTSDNYVSSMQSLVTGPRFIRYIPGSVYIPLEYENGYNDGYSEGTTDTEDYYEDLIIPAVKLEYEEIGYDKGYLQGKNDTLNQGSGVALFDAFTLIGKGFEAWNPILNIQVLPGLTIGVFIAIPIVIAVVIIVIKLLQR